MSTRQSALNFDQPYTAKEKAALAAGVAATLWASFTTSEKNLVRFGMFPAEKMRQGELQLSDLERDASRLLAVALMDCAKADGGMRA